MVSILLSDCENIISALLRDRNFEILNYQVIPFDEIIGYLGHHCTLNITYKYNSATHCSSIFVKSLPQGESQRKFLEDFDGVLKEKNFYTKFCPLLDKYEISILCKSVPTCYHTNADSFFFEDLSAQGYRTLPSRIPFKLDCVKAALATFAKLHSSALILEETRQFRLIEDFSKELQESFYLDSDSCVCALKSSKGGVKALIDLTPEDDMKISKEWFTKRALEGCDLLPTFVKPSTRFRNTICHGDSYAKNLLFKFHEEKVEDCIIVDFQTYRYGPPAQDVLLFIHLSTDRELRKGHLEELLDYYYRELNCNMAKYGFENVVTKKDFEESCRFYKEFVLLQTLVHFHVVILTDQIAKELFGDEEYARSVIFGDRYDFVKMVCQRDPIYRRRSFEAITDLREFYEKY